MENLKCCFDFNSAIGTNLAEKTQSLYVVLRRMQWMAAKTEKLLPNILIISPLVLGILEIADAIQPTYLSLKIDQLPVIESYIPIGKAWKNWDIYIDNKTFDEHHIYMTYLINDNLPERDRFVKISLINFVMSNNFGYYNLQ